MNTSRLLKCAGAVMALAVVSACGGGSTVAPAGPTFNASYVNKTLFVNGRPTTAARLVAAPSFANLVPLKKKSSKDYEYVIGYYGSYASMFNYPKSAEQVGEINGAGGQGCTNAQFGYGKKIIWNAGRQNDEVIEYSVPSNKMLKSVSLPYSVTASCSMNAKGDLAVGILLSNSYGPAGQMVIFKNATGTGKVYQTPLREEFFSGYDAKGDLFADGYDPNGQWMLVELPVGTSKFVTINASNSPGFPGSVQWDGTYLTVFDQDSSQTYQYTVTGTTATLKNTVTYSGIYDCAQT
jgi:hypothetical protein